jgi:aminoethylphosphonate catabolism LysR family transcriptional regulator
MSPTQARAFLAVANAGSFTAAARFLNVSQPTVTTQVKDLETFYGVELFHRHGRGVNLTTTGEELLSIVRRIYANQQDAVQYLQAVQGLNTGQMRIGAYGPYHAIELLSVFHQRYPGLETSLSFANSGQLQDDIFGHRIDIAVFSRVEQRAEFHTLAYDQSRLIAIVGKAHPWSRRKSIDVRELNDQPVILREPGSEVRRAYIEIERRYDLKPLSAIEVGSREGTVAAAALNAGVAMIFDEGLFPEQSVCKLRIRDVDYVAQVNVVCLEERKTNRAISAFFEIAEEMRSAPRQPRQPRQPSLRGQRERK